MNAARITTHQSHIPEKKAGSFFSGGRIFPKLSINAPGDKFEQEADKVAGQVISRMQNSAEVAPVAPHTSLPPVQRACQDCREEEQLQKKEKPESESEPIQTAPVTAGAGTDDQDGSPELSAHLQGSKGKGHSLPGQTLSAMNHAFGADFSKVKVHHGSPAGQMSQSIQAKAFTHGSDVYFNQGQYQPGTATGDRLLAHELTHVLQQRSATPAKIQRDFALKPLQPLTPNTSLTAAAQREALLHNNGLGFTRAELIALSDLFGNKLDLDTDALKAEIIQRVARYQMQYQLPIHGKIDYQTAEVVLLELKKEEDFMGKPLSQPFQEIKRKLNRKYAHQTNSAVLYVGMNSYENESKQVASNLPYEKEGQLHSVTGATKAKAVEVNGQTIDMTTDEGVKLFVDSLNITDPILKAKVMALIKSKFPTNRDEFGLLIKEYSLAETGYNQRMTRVILSGHSGGLSFFGGIESSIDFTDLIKIKELFPRAASQVLHLMVSACSAGTQSNIEEVFVKAFPNLRTVWAYYDACPSPANIHINQWLNETKGDIHKLRQPGGSGISIWNEGVYQGNSSMTKDRALARVTDEEGNYQKYFSGEILVPNAYSGGLFQYFNALRGLLGRSDLTNDEKIKYEARKAQALRLRFYSDVSVRFMARDGQLIKDAYGSTTVDFALLNRKQAMDRIAAFDTEAKGPADKKAEAKMKLNTCLKNLEKSCIPENWVAH